MHITDNLLCVARKLCGNYHASGGVISFADKACYSCGAFEFCQRVAMLVQNEVNSNSYSIVTIVTRSPDSYSNPGG